ncbi:BTB/POZ domain-containing protein 2 [Folsomia candida]|nr:BTB/POZ domain-containing protein 2 [Folsomia candida]
MADRSNSQSLVAMVGRLFETGLYSDLAILVGEEQFRFNVHKVFVAGRSSVFDTMLEKRWIEQSQGQSYTEEEGKIIVHLPQHGVDAFRIFLQYLYTDELKMDENIDLSLEVLELSNFYDVPKLLGEIIEQIKGRIGVKNCYEIYRRTKHIDSALSEESFEFLLRNIKSFGETDAFLLCDYETVKTVLKQDVLDIGEVDLFKAVKKWGDHVSDTDEDEDRPRSTVMPELLEMIRFPIIGMQDFAAEVVPTGVLAKDEVIEMFLYFAKPEKTKTKYESSPRVKKLVMAGPQALRFPVDTGSSRVTFHIMEKKMVEEFPAELQLQVSNRVSLSGIVVNSSDIFQLIQNPQTVTFQLFIQQPLCFYTARLRQDSTQRLTPPLISSNLEIAAQFELEPGTVYNFTVKCSTDTVYGGPLNSSQEKIYQRIKPFGRQPCNGRIHDGDVTATFHTPNFGNACPNVNSWIRDLLFSPV